MPFINISFIFLIAFYSISWLMPLYGQPTDNMEKQLESIGYAGKGKLPFEVKKGMTMDEVQRKVGDVEVLRKDSQDVVYTVYFDKHGIEFADITFQFRDNALYKVIVETYMNFETYDGLLYDAVFDDLSKKYGSPAIEGNAAMWLKSKKKIGKSLKVTLENIEWEQDAGFVLTWEYF